jgi:hypothetical protein
MSWEKYVPKEMREKFREAFIRILVTKKIDSLMNDACFFGTHHHYSSCTVDKDCEDCYGDSTDRDLKEYAQSFNLDLWCEVFGELMIEPVYQVEDNDEAEEGEESDGCEDNVEEVNETISTKRREQDSIEGESNIIQNSEKKIKL